MKWIIVLILFISCSDNINENMRLFTQSLSSSSNFILPINGVRVLIVSGQSNAGGRALNTDAAAGELLPNSDIQIFSLYPLGSEQFYDLDIEQNNMQTNPVNAPFSFHGVELGLGNEFVNSFNNEVLYLIKKAIGGTKIIESLPGGSVYDSLWPSYVKKAINQLINAGKRPFVYFYFHQGEGDANDIDYLNYSANLDTLIAQWRTNLGNELPFLFAEILELGASGTRESEINQFFLDKANASQFIEVVTAKDLTNNGDNQHYDYAAQKIIANRVLVGMNLLTPIEITSLIP